MEPLYKFQNIESLTQLKRLTQIIENKKIWIPRVDSLNDPFEAILYKAKSISLLSGVQELDGDKKRRIRDAQGNIAYAMSQSRGVLSFCRTNTNSLMWSHYTNGLRGICLEFDKSLIPFSPNIREVKYTELKRYTTSPFGVLKFIDPLLLKGLPWKYEKESRYISIGGNQLEDIGDSIKRIHIGCKVCNIFTRFILKLAERNGIEVTYVDIAEINDEFELVPNDEFFRKRNAWSMMRVDGTYAPTTSGIYEQFKELHQELYKDLSDESFKTLSSLFNEYEEKYRSRDND